MIEKLVHWALTEYGLFNWYSRLAHSRHFYDGFVDYCEDSTNYLVSKMDSQGDFSYFYQFNGCVVFFLLTVASPIGNFLLRYLELGTGTPYHETESLVDFSRLGKITHAIKNGHFRLTSGQTSGKNFISRNFYWTKSCVLKFQGESLGIVFFIRWSYEKLSARKTASWQKNAKKRRNC